MAAVDIYTETGELTREQVEQMGPRYALQPMDSEVYLNAAEDLIRQAEQSGDEIVVVHFLGTDTISVNYVDQPPLSGQKHILIMNGLMDFVVSGQQEVSVTEIIDNVFWGDYLDYRTEEEVVGGKLVELENATSSSMFFYDNETKRIVFPAPVVIIDNRFRAPIEQVPEEETAPEQRSSPQLVVSEVVLAKEGISKYTKLPKYTVNINGSEVLFSADELAVLRVLQSRLDEKTTRADVLTSEEWLSFDRSDSAQQQAFAKAVKSLNIKLPGLIARHGIKGGAYLKLDTPIVLQLAETKDDHTDPAPKKKGTPGLVDYNDVQKSSETGETFEALVISSLTTGTEIPREAVPTDLRQMLNQLISATGVVLANSQCSDAIRQRAREVRQSAIQKLVSMSNPNNNAQASPQIYRQRYISRTVRDPSEPIPWQEWANCLGVDPELFFPERGASTREAKEVCRGCVVREACLEYALYNGEKFGIWGGLSERERRRLRRQRAQAKKRSAD